MTSSLNDRGRPWDDLPSMPGYQTDNENQTGQTSGQGPVGTINAFGFENIDNLTNQTPPWVLNNKGTYANYAGTPQLPSPNGQQTVDDQPTPFTPAQQAIVNKFYDSDLESALLSALNTANPPLNPNQITELVQLIKTGDFSHIPASLQTIFSQATVQATQDTQAEFSLPTAWSRGTTDHATWTPINTAAVPSDQSAQDITSHLLANVDQVLNDLTNAGLVLSQTLGDDNLSRVALADFLKAIGKAIQQLKKEMRDLQLIDAEVTKNANRAKLDQVADSRDRELDMEKSMQEMREKQDKMRKTSLAMKIAGPIIAALSCIAGVAISVCTLGIGTPAGVALMATGIALGVAMTVYAIVDSVADVSSKMIDAFNNWADSLTPVPPNSEQDRARNKFLIVAAIAVVAAALIAAMMLTGGGEALTANVASQSAEQAATQAIKQTLVELVKQLTVKEIGQATAEVIKQILIQFTITFVMGTNALPQYLAEIVKSQGGNTQSQQIVQFLTMAVEMLVIILALAKGGGGAKNLGKGIKDSVTDIGQGIKSGAQQAVQSAKAALNRGVKETADMIAEEIAETIQELCKQILALLKSLPGLPLSAINDIKATLNLVRDPADGSINKGFVKMIAGIIQGAPQLAQAVAGAVQGALLVQVSRILEQQGEIQASLDLLKSMADLLEKLVNNLQQGISSRERFIEDLGQMFNSVYAAAAQAFGRLSQSILPQGQA